jgi:hypothetical protein
MKQAIINEREIEQAFEIILRRKPKVAEIDDWVKKCSNITELCDLLIKSVEFKGTFEKQNKNGIDWPLSQVFIINKLKIIYCPIGKNANTFMKKVLIGASGIEQAKFIINHDIHLLTDRINTGLQLSDLPISEVSKVVHSDKYFRFAIVRDPRRRILSAYWEKFVLNRNWTGNQIHTSELVQEVQSANGNSTIDFNRGITFREFVETICSKKPQVLDPHWRPQHLYLQGIDYDTLYDQSAIGILLNRIEERLGGKVDRKKFNETGSGQGSFIRDAAEMSPSCLTKHGAISWESFFNNDLDFLVKSYFSLDFTLYNLSQKKFVEHQDGVNNKSI